MDARAAAAAELLAAFAERTGLTSERPARRYLWTDAFAVCTYVGLQRATGDPLYLELAHRLVTRVHHTLGRHRDDDARVGWISGLPAAAGEAHPTRGGLRIGKRFAERGPEDAFDDALEWERDGQYFHYLTKWMHALDVLARTTGEPRFDAWAHDLALAAYRGFAHATPGGPRMYWKASIDLTRPLVASMGHHDPLDGLVTYRQLAKPPATPIAAFNAMLDRAHLATSDPLGLGGLLVDAARVHQLAAHGAWPPDDALLTALLAAARVGLAHYARGGELQARPERRLAFRELGLAIGLAALAQLPAARTRELAAFAPLRAEIEACWGEPAHRATRTWRDHQDINDVMLATSLAPEGFVTLPARRHARALATPGAGDDPAARPRSDR